MFAVRITRPIHGLETGDSIVASPILGPHFALVRLIPARYAQLLQLDNAGALEYLTGPIQTDQVIRLLESHFQRLRRQTSGLALLR